LKVEQKEIRRRCYQYAESVFGWRKAREKARYRGRKRVYRDLGGVLAVGLDAGLARLDAVAHFDALVAEVQNVAHRGGGVLHLAARVHHRLGGGARHQGRRFRRFPVAPLLLQRALRLVHLPPHALRRVHHLRLELFHFGEERRVLERCFAEVLLQVVVALLELARGVPQA
jgi:hypothetical protein